METGYVIVSAAITILSLILLIVSLYSYRISRNTKLPFVTAVFVFFFIRGILLSVGLFYSPLEFLVSSYYMWVFDLFILTLLYVASLKR